ncbi:hypothetical protein Tco_0642279 [Tanacetum coccineum]
MEKYYNVRVRNTSFKPGDLIYRNNEARHTEDGGKLGPKWEGLYEVTEALGKGAYKLRDLNGNVLSRTWNVCNLKKCYVHEIENHKLKELKRAPAWYPVPPARKQSWERRERQWVVSGEQC